MKDLIEQLIIELGEDPRREGLQKTPERVESMLQFLTSGYRRDVKEVLNEAVFTEDKYDEMVLVEVWAMAACFASIKSSHSESSSSSPRRCCRR